MGVWFIDPMYAVDFVLGVFAGRHDDSYLHDVVGEVLAERVQLECGGGDRESLHGHGGYVDRVKMHACCGQPASVVGGYINSTTRKRDDGHWVVCDILPLA